MTRYRAVSRALPCRYLTVEGLPTTDPAKAALFLDASPVVYFIEAERPDDAHLWTWEPVDAAQRNP